MFTAKELEIAWVSFQLNVAASRPTLGPLYDLAFNARKLHTFEPQRAPRALLIQAVQGPTAGEPNGIPDALYIATSGTYAARSTSVLAASAILLHADSAIQKLAADLGQANGAAMLAGEELPDSGSPAVKASTLIWAGANNVRHIDEWYAWRNTYLNPQTRAERDKREQHRRSMEPIAAVLGVPTPVTEIAAFEILQHLVALSDTKGEYDRLELHLLTIGQELVARAGYRNAIIGVTVNGYADARTLNQIPADQVNMSDGIMRAASSLPDSNRLGAVPPFSQSGEQ